MKKTSIVFKVFYIPGIPVDTTELFLDSNLITQIPTEQLAKLNKLTKLWVFTDYYCCSNKIHEAWKLLSSMSQTNVSKCYFQSFVFEVSNNWSCISASDDTELFLMYESSSLNVINVFSFPISQVLDNVWKRSQGPLAQRTGDDRERHVYATDSSLNPHPLLQQAAVSGRASLLLARLIADSLAARKWPRDARRKRFLWPRQHHAHVGF